MSLINQMLQDLDARRAAHGIGSRLPSDVRPLPVAAQSRWSGVAMPGAIILLALVLAGGYAAYRRADGAGVVDQVAAPAAPVASPAAPGPAQSGAVDERAMGATGRPPGGVQEPPGPESNAPALAEPPPAPAGSPVALEVPSTPSVPSEAGDLSLRLANTLVEPETGKVAAKTEPAVGDAPMPQGNEKGRERAGGRAARRELAADASPPRKSPVPSMPASVAPPVREKPVLFASPRPGVVEPTIRKSEPVSSPRQRVESAYQKAVAAVNLGRGDDAMAGLRGALAEDAYHVASRQLLVRLLIDGKRIDEAEQVLREGLRVLPAKIDWAMTLARLQVDRGELAEASKTLDDALPAAAGSADFQGFAAYVSQRLGRHAEAAERFEAAARLEPNDGRWWLGLGLSLDAVGQRDRAVLAFERARQTANLSPELMALVEQKLR